MRARETSAFVRVVSNENRRVVELLRIVHFVLVVREHPTVNNRPCHATLAAGCGHNPLRRHVSQFRDRCRSGTFGERFSSTFSVRKRTHVFTRLPRRPLMTKRAAAL